MVGRRRRRVEHPLLISCPKKELVFVRNDHVVKNPRRVVVNRMNLSKSMVNSNEDRQLITSVLGTRPTKTVVLDGQPHKGPWAGSRIEGVGYQ